jgi:hypothetical protein
MTYYILSDLAGNTVAVAENFAATSEAWRFLHASGFTRKIDTPGAIYNLYAVDGTEQKHVGCVVPKKRKPGA